MATKGSRAAREDRLQVLENSLIEGMPSSEVVSAAAGKFGISPQMAWRDLALIRQRWAEAGREALMHSAVALGRAIRRRNFLYQRAVKIGDLRMALDAEKDLCHLEGLYPPSDHELRLKGSSSEPVEVKTTGTPACPDVGQLAAVLRILAEVGALQSAPVDDTPAEEGHPAEAAQAGA